MERLLQDIGPLLGCAFFAVLFLQSGFDKVFDRSGNLAWMTPHFEKTPFRDRMPMMLSALTILEVGAGFFNLFGVGFVLAGPSRTVAHYALIAATLTLLCLFAGQRIAKDYAGAASLAAYFAVGLIAVLASA